MTRPELYDDIDGDFMEWLDEPGQGIAPAPDYEAPPVDAAATASVEAPARPVTEDDALQDVEAIPDPPRDWFVRDAQVLPASARTGVHYFVNGKDYCTDLARAIAGAEDHIYLTGLHFMQDFGLVRTASRTLTLAQALTAKADADVKIHLLVNLFWPEEGHMIGHWQRAQFRYFNRPHTRDSFGNSSARRGELIRTMAEIGGAWAASNAGQRILMALIGANGLLERYFPATLDLFRALRHPNIKCRLDVHPGHIMHSHHQKTVVIDDRIAYLGGIDLTHVDGDRWDTSAHGVNGRHTNRAEKYWHDVHGRVDGRPALMVAENFKDRWRNGVLYGVPASSLRGTRQVRLQRDRNNGREFGSAPPRPSIPRPARYRIADIRRFTRPKLQFVRSMPAARGYSVPRGQWERTAKDAYLTGIGAGRELIYLENQWIADEHVWSALTQGARTNQRLDYQVVLMMPNEPLRAAGAGANQDIFTELNLLKLLRAGYYSRTVSVFSLVQPQDNDRQIYVHSKIMTVDDVWSLIGSANAGGISLEGVRDLPTLLRVLNQIRMSRRLTRAQLRQILQIVFGQGDRPDTELSFITLGPAFADNLRTSLWREHLTGSGRALTGTTRTDIDTLRTVANSGRHRLRNHPYLVTAFKTDSFPGIDLRQFSYGPGDVQLIFDAAGRNFRRNTQRLMRELQKLPQLLTSVNTELQPYDASMQQRYRAHFTATVAPYLRQLSTIVTPEASRLAQLADVVERFGGRSSMPNV